MIPNSSGKHLSKPSPTAGRPSEALCPTKKKTKKALKIKCTYMLENANIPTSSKCRIEVLECTKDAHALWERIYITNTNYE